MEIDRLANKREENAITKIDEYIYVYICIYSGSQVVRASDFGFVDISRFESSSLLAGTLFPWQGTSP